MKHLMLDLETLGQTADCVFLSLAAVQFDLKGKIGLTYTKNVALNSALKHNRKISSDTIKWWLEQNPKIMAKMFINPLSLEEVLDSFRFFCIGLGEPNLNVWSNGASFDIPILKHAYENIGMELPWKFYNERCYRTAFALSGLSKTPKDQNLAHDPLEDCYYQIQELLKALKKLDYVE